MQTEARVGGGVVVEGGGPAHKLVAHHQRHQQQKSLNQQSHIGTISQLLAGGVAGAVSKTCTAPLARLTILFQVQGMHSNAATLKKACIWQEASRIVREEGFRAFWKGNLVTIVHRLPYSSISFYSFERYKNLLQSVLGMENHGTSMSADMLIRLAGGGLAGVTAASATYPLDLVRTRLSAQTNAIYYRGIWHALRTISREEGILGLYKGLGATLLGVGPNLAISFSVYDTVRSYWQSQRPEDSPVLVSLACGSLSGIASSTETIAGIQQRKLIRLAVFDAFDAEKQLVLRRVSTGEPALFMESNKNVRGVPLLLRWDIELDVIFYSIFSVTFPLDLVRRRMQLEGAAGRERVYKTGLFGTFGQIIRSEGLRGLYRGILPEYYKVVPSIGIVFMTYEKLKQILSDVSAC